MLHLYVFKFVCNSSWILSCNLGKVALKKCPCMCLWMHVCALTTETSASADYKWFLTCPQTVHTPHQSIPILTFSTASTHRPDNPHTETHTHTHKGTKTNGFIIFFLSLWLDLYEKFICKETFKRWVAVNKQLWHWLTTHYVGYFMCLLFWYLYIWKQSSCDM